MAHVLANLSVKLLTQPRQQSLGCRFLVRPMASVHRYLIDAMYALITQHGAGHRPERALFLGQAPERPARANRSRPLGQTVSPVMDTKLNQDIARLLSAAHNAIPVLRHNAEQLETIGQDSTTERDAVRQLNMAVQLLEYRLALSKDGTGTLEA